MSSICPSKDEFKERDNARREQAQKEALAKMGMAIRENYATSRQVTLEFPCSELDEQSKDWLRQQLIELKWLVTIHQKTRTNLRGPDTRYWEVTVE